jgi:hypothetical protein
VDSSLLQIIINDMNNTPMFRPDVTMHHPVNHNICVIDVQQQGQQQEQEQQQQSSW